MGLLEEALHASGGLLLWRQAQRFTAHVSIGGALCTQKCSSAQLKELLVEGSTRDQVLEITGFMAADRRALYRPDWVALEGSDGRRLKERTATPAEFHPAYEYHVGRAAARALLRVLHLELHERALRSLRPGL